MGRILSLFIVAIAVFITAYMTLRIPAKTTSSASVIFLHGLGDSGEGWKFLAEEARNRKRLQHVNFVFPDAPHRKVTLNFGAEMPAWYDIKKLAAISLADQDEEGILESAQTLQKLIQKEISVGIKPERIVVGGFSQGGAVSLTNYMTSDLAVGGYLILSSYLPLADLLLGKETPPVNVHTPVFFGHGDADSVIKYDYGVASYEALKKEGNDKAEWHGYPGLVHSVSPKELDDVFDYLDKVLPAK